MFSVIVYIMIYTGIPTLYKYYKTVNLNTQINRVVNESDDMQELEYNLQIMKRHSNAIVTYEINGEFYNCFFQEYCTSVPNQNIDIRGRNGINYIKVDTSVKIDDELVYIHFIMPLSSTQEVQNILVLFLPLFGLLSVSMALLLSNLISSKLSSGIIKLNEDAKKITNLDFNVDQSIKSDDELGDLSISLKKLANELETNINQLQKTNEKLYSDIEKERIMEEERRAYIATLSHDLKTPLTAIKGQLEGMIYNVGKYKDRDTYLKKNVSLVNNMQEIIQSIIISSKLDDYNTTLNITDFNIIRHVTLVLDELDFNIEAKNIDVLVNIDNDLNIKADGSLFSKALTNLISNAIEYCDDNTQIVIAANQDYFEITNITKDFDDSILKDNLIFKPFYRQDKSRNKSGSGLGMYISKKIIELHKFKITPSFEKESKMFKLKIEFK
ncbi:sensor histidine kinase [Mycoplasma sp. P36-A1]|uniref:sensor histidine kinase n=1 Tax=Mycoplasma sp. P36-A1 TaxID=3252900 RepID=UPI003C2B79D5